MTVNEAAEMYFEMKQFLMKPASYTNSQRLYRDHIQEQLGNVECETITSREMQKFYNSLVQKKQKRNTEKTLSKHTAKDIFTFAKTILYFAMENGKMTERRFKTKVPCGFAETDNGQDDFLDEENYKKIITNATNISQSGKYNQARIFTILALTTGMRIGEVCGLKWCDIDFDNNTIKVLRTVQRITNFDNTTYLHIGEPKSKTSRRTVILTDSAKEALCKYKLLFREECAPNNFVLTNKSTPTEPRTIRSAYKRFINHYKIPYIHPHGLRHTFATYAIDNGVDIKTTSLLLGHANTSITLDVYTHVTERQMRNTIDKLNKITSI